MTSPDLFAAMRARTVAALREILPDLPEDAFAKAARYSSITPPAAPSRV